jgi:hypothetical protein
MGAVGFIDWLDGLRLYWRIYRNERDLPFAVNASRHVDVRSLRRSDLDGSY